MAVPQPSQPAPDTDSAVYRTLLESTKAIPWRIDWKTMQFSYIGPQIEKLLGWPQSSWLTVEDWSSRMHPEDRDYVVNFCVSQSQNGIDHEADYRALTRDGSYVWIRDVVHVVRKDGEVEALVGFMFDISERKKQELELQRLKGELEALSFRDALTDIANRRLFDQVLEREWLAARRSGQPLSLVLLDIDCFKEYNDHYGHPAGDAALRTVARLLTAALARPRDFVARIGGEEFALLLPETDVGAALVIAERCRRAVEQTAIPHRQSRVGAHLTVSVGVGTRTPTPTDTAPAFIETIDQRLYQAKQGGRNRVQA